MERGFVLMEAFQLSYLFRVIFSTCFDIILNDWLGSRGDLVWCGLLSGVPAQNVEIGSFRKGVLAEAGNAAVSKSIVASYPLCKRPMWLTLRCVGGIGFEDGGRRRRQAFGAKY